MHPSKYLLTGEGLQLCSPQIQRWLDESPEVAPWCALVRLGLSQPELEVSVTEGRNPERLAEAV